MQEEGISVQDHYVAFDEAYDITVLQNFKGSFASLAGEENALEADPWPMAKRESHHMMIYVLWVCSEHHAC